MKNDNTRAKAQTGSTVWDLSENIVAGCFIGKNESDAITMYKVREDSTCRVLFVVCSLSCALCRVRCHVRCWALFGGVMCCVVMCVIVLEPSTAAFYNLL